MTAHLSLMAKGGELIISLGLGVDPSAYLVTERGLAIPGRSAPRSLAGRFHIGRCIRRAFSAAY